MVRRNQASFFTKVVVLTRRSFVNMYRDVGYYWLRLGIYISISLCLGTIYYNFGYGYDSIRVSWLVIVLLSRTIHQVNYKSNYCYFSCYSRDHPC